MPSLKAINSLEKKESINGFKKCCGSTKWATSMTVARPFESINSLYQKADQIWFNLNNEDWMEAFSHHPRIGANIETLREKFKNTAQWSNDEQKGIQSATDETLLALQKGNLEYEKKFGHIFLICASGKSAKEMLDSLLERMKNDIKSELKIAITEQSKITKLRLEKWMEEIL